MTFPLRNLVGFRRGFIDMTGKIAGPFVAVREMPSVGQGARWELRCKHCNRKRVMTGQAMRRAEVDRRRIRCDECMKYE